MPGVESSTPPDSTRPRVGWICVDSAEPRALATWWQQLIGGEVAVDEDGDVSLTGGPVPLLFLEVSDLKIGKNRVHLDLRTPDYDGASALALDLGATEAHDVYVGEKWRVFRDPEGNEFCIIRPSAVATSGGTGPGGDLTPGA